MTRQTGTGLVHGLRSDVAWAAAGRLIVLAAGFLISTVVARSLDRADTGTWFLIWSSATLLSGVAEAGAPMLAVRVVTVGRQAFPVRWLGSLVAAGSALSAILLGVGSRFFAGPGILRSWWPAIAVLAAALAFERLASEVLRGYGRIGWASTTGGATSRVLTLGGLLLLVVAGVEFPLDAVVGIAVGGTVAATAVGTAASAAHGRLAVPGPQQLIIRPREALPLWGNRLSNLALGQADLIIVGAFVTAGAAADYGIALRLSALVSLPLAVANAVLPHRIATLHAQGRRGELQAVLRRSARQVLVAAILSACAVGVASRWAIAPIFGAAYTDAWPLVAILSLGQVASAFAASAGQVLVNTGHGRALLRITATSAAVMIVAGSIAATRGAVWVAVTAAMALAGHNVAAARATLLLTGLDSRATAPAT